MSKRRGGIQGGAIPANSALHRLKIAASSYFSFSMQATMLSPMHEPVIQSAALNLARLKTERLRIFGVLIFAGVLVAVTAIRTLVLHTGAPVDVWLADVGLVALLVVYELVTLRWAKRALERSTNIPGAWWAFGMVFEIVLPAFWMAVLSSARVAPEYQPLANPAALVFF